MAVLTGAAREARFLFKVGEIDFAVADFSVREAISEPFDIDLTLASEDEIDFDDVIGQVALLTLLESEPDRYFNGIVSEFMKIGLRGRFYVYQARVVPSIRLLSFEQDCRIFQNKTVQEIVAQIFNERRITSDRYKFRLQNSYEPREYCVQYRETDLNFISRLLEEEGIFYFFEHDREKHLMVFGDSTVNYQPISGTVAVPFRPSGGLGVTEEFVKDFRFQRQIRTGKVTFRDYNFIRPSLDLTSQKKADSFDELEHYDYPGDYDDKNRGKSLAEIRLQESMMLKDRIKGQSVCPRFVPGFTFKLADHDIEAFNQEYLLIEINHVGTQPQVLEEKASDESGSSYANHFMGVPSSTIIRPARNTPKPVVEGVQTAIVVGPSGEEIYTDEHGRIKVQFHWDREGNKDDKSSCWIRVASIFAGGQYGAIFIPRIGQEVVVDFLEGDPDRPLVTGRVYNADLMPPYTLPDKKTKSTIKTNSSIGGEGFNEIRFEDEKGKEQLFLHAEKDLDIRVKNDRRELVGNDRHLIVKRDLKEKVEFDKHLTVEKSEFKEVKTDYNLKVGGKTAVEVTGSSSLKVTGNMIESFNANHSENVTGTFHLKGMNIKLEGMTGMELKVGGSSIVLTPAAIFIQGGPLVNINSGSGPPVAPAASSLVPPTAPVAPDAAADASPGKDVSSQEKRHKESTDEEKKEKKSWIEIELVDEEGNPVPGERYKVTLPDGKTVAEGTLDENGFARVNGIDPGSCKITFPNLDKDAWEKT